MSFSLNKKNLIFKWYEEKTVNKGSNSFILTNVVPAGATLEIFDEKYGLEWSKVLHWNISGQVITLTETALTETLKFKIYCFV